MLTLYITWSSGRRRRIDHWMLADLFQLWAPSPGAIIFLGLERTPTGLNARWMRSVSFWKRKREIPSSQTNRLTDGCHTQGDQKREKIKVSVCGTTTTRKKGRRRRRRQMSLIKSYRRTRWTGERKAEWAKGSFSIWKIPDIDKNPHAGSACVSFLPFSYRIADCLDRWTVEKTETDATRFWLPCSACLLLQVSYSTWFFLVDENATRSNRVYLSQN